MATKAFLFVIAFIGCVEVGMTLAHLSSGLVPQRTPEGMAINATVLGALAVWALVLLLTK